VVEDNVCIDMNVEFSIKGSANREKNKISFTYFLFRDAAYLSFFYQR